MNDFKNNLEDIIGTEYKPTLEGLLNLIRLKINSLNEDFNNLENLIKNSSSTKFGDNSE